MKTDQPSHGSGKTYFNRLKSTGQSRVALRAQARAKGEWKPGWDKKDEWEHSKSLK